MKVQGAFKFLYSSFPKKDTTVHVYVYALVSVGSVRRHSKRLLRSLAGSELIIHHSPESNVVPGVAKVKQRARAGAARTSYGET